MAYYALGNQQQNSWLKNLVVYEVTRAELLETVSTN